MNALIADRKVSYDFNDADADYGDAIQDLLDVLTWGGGGWTFQLSKSSVLF